MYVTSVGACTHPNSQTPMSAARIAAQAQRVGRVGDKFVRGNQTLDSLCVALGGAGIGRVPGANPQPAAADFRNAPSVGSPVTPDGLYGGDPRGGAIRVRVPHVPAVATACHYPEVLPLETVFPIVPPVTPHATAAPAPVAAPVADRPDPDLCANVTPANVCEAARAGCFLDPQLSRAQWLACARAGWSGNQNRFPWVLLRGGAQRGRVFGDVNLDPPSAGGMAGLGDLSPGACWAGVILAGVSAYFLADGFKGLMRGAK